MTLLTFNLLVTLSMVGVFAVGAATAGEYLLRKRSGWSAKSQRSDGFPDDVLRTTVTRIKEHGPYVRVEVSNVSVQAAFELEITLDDAEALRLKEDDTIYVPGVYAPAGRAKMKADTHGHPAEMWRWLMIQRSTLPDDPPERETVFMDYRVHFVDYRARKKDYKSSS